MINLTKGNTETIYFTGTEKATLTDPDFRFTFTNRVTSDTVVIDLVNTSTVGRYDKGTIEVDEYFGGMDEGLWSYSVLEVAESVTGVVVETGYMYLRPAVAFAPTEYAGQSNEFITYDGE